jgi:hypothetical protein
MTTIPANTFATLETLEKALTDLGALAKVLLVRVQADLTARKYQDPTRHALLSRMETVLGDLVASLA